MSANSPFIDPDLTPSKHQWEFIFPELSPRAGRWLCGMLAVPIRRPFDELPPATQAALGDLEKELTMRGLGADTEQAFLMLRLVVTFGSLPSASGLFSPEALDAESSSFDWDSLFDTQGSGILLRLSPAISYRILTTDRAARDAWVKLPTQARAESYRKPLFETFPELAGELESVPPDITVPPDAWSFLTIGRDRFFALIRCRDGRLAESDLQHIPVFEEGSTEHDPFVKAATELRILEWIYNGKSTNSVLCDFDRILRPIEIRDRPANLPMDGIPRFADEYEFLFSEDREHILELLPSDAARKSCGDYLFELVKKEDVTGLTPVLRHLLPFDDKSYVPYFGRRDMRSMSKIARLLASRLSEPSMLVAFRSLLSEARPHPGVRRDPFLQCLLDRLDDRLTKNPSPERSVLYSLFFLAYIDTPVGVGSDLRSIESMVQVCLASERGLISLWEIEEAASLDEYMRTWWRAKVLRTFFSIVAATEAGRHVAQDPRNRALLKCADSAKADGFPIACLGAPMLDLLRIPRDEPFLDRIGQQGIGEEDHDAALVLCALLSAGSEAAASQLHLGLGNGKRFPAYVVLTDILASQAENTEVDSQSLVKALRARGLFSGMNLPVLRSLIQDDALLAKERLEDLHCNSSDSPSHVVEAFWMANHELFIGGDHPNPRSFLPGSLSILSQFAVELIDGGVSPGDPKAAILGLCIASKVFVFNNEHSVSNPKFLDVCSREALSVLDRMRKAARSGDLDAGLPDLLGALRAVSLIVHRYKGWWRVLKQYFLALRYLDHAVLGPDLDPDPSGVEDPWKAIPREIHWILDRPWKAEEGRQLRREMTHDLLEFLKPLRTIDVRDLKQHLRGKQGFAANLAEPDPDVRYAYVRAVADLGADPGENGHFHHQTLDKVAANDPSPMVREAATKAADSIRTRSGYRSGSDKRHLLNAWWWIRQAHMILVRAPLDRDGALKRRDAEVRR